MAGGLAETVATGVRTLMAEKRISQTRLGDLLGLSQPAISRRVRGEIPFDVAELGKVAELLDVPVGELFSPATVSVAVPDEVSPSRATGQGS